MKTRKLTALLLSLILLLFCISPSFAEVEATSIDSLSALPAYGANPEYALWTTVPYLVKDAAKQFTATISANEDLTRFEIQCMFYEDQLAVMEKNGEEIRVTEDRTGFMHAFGAELVGYALEQNVWLPTAQSMGTYGVFQDPGDAPVAFNYVEDTRPLYVQAGIWDEDFQRTNERLNHMAFLVDDPDLAAAKQPCDKKGTVVPVDYETFYYAKDAADGDALSHQTPITKTAYVYLPYGYDSKTCYNILYLLHGGGDTGTKWFSQQDNADGEVGEGYAVNILDNLFAAGKADPFIVVTPGLYNDNDPETQKYNGYTETFAYELRDLMSVVESKYNTYAEGERPEDYIASRDHRALAGLSMGSITTWHSGIAQCLDIISWFGNMSGAPSANIDEASSYIQENIIPALKSGQDSGYQINLLLGMNGANDMALQPHVVAHKLLTEFAESDDVLSVGENYDFIVSDGIHSFEAWNLYLYDLTQVLFQ